MIAARTFRDMDSVFEILQSIENALSVLEDRSDELIEEERIAVVRNLAYVSEKASRIVKELAKDMLDEMAPTL
jgi:uncharacterized protein with HEPN domain